MMGLGRRGGRSGCDASRKKHRGGGGKEKFVVPFRAGDAVGLGMGGGVELSARKGRGGRLWSRGTWRRVGIFRLLWH